MATATTTTEASQDIPAKLLTEKEVASILNCCEKTVYRLRKAGKIRCVKLGAAVRYTPEEIRRFIDSQMNQDDCSANSNVPEAWGTCRWFFSCLCKCVMPSLIYFDQSFSMNYDFALVLLVLLALVVIGKPEVIRDVAKRFPPNGKEN